MEQAKLFQRLGRGGDQKYNETLTPTKIMSSSKNMGALPDVLIHNIATIRN